VFETRTFRIDQEDAAVTSAGCGFDEPTDCFKYFGHRTAARNHVQQPFLTGEHSFSLLPVVDVRLQHVPTGDAILGVPKRQTAYVKPAINAVRTAQALLDLERFSSVYRSLPRSNHRGKIIRMNGVASRPALQFFERRAEIFQDMAVDAFDFARRGHESD
jgi:hypothetical protein